MGKHPAQGQSLFAAPLGTQPGEIPPQVAATVPDAEQEEYEAVYAPDVAITLPDVPDANEAPLKLSEVLTEQDLKLHGLCDDGAMVFPQTVKAGQAAKQVFHDRVLLQKVLLWGAPEIELSKLVDKMGDKVEYKDADGRSRSTRVRPSQKEAGHESFVHDSHICKGLGRAYQSCHSFLSSNFFRKVSC